MTVVTLWICWYQHFRDSGSEVKIKEDLVSGLVHRRASGQASGSMDEDASAWSFAMERLVRGAMEAGGLRAGDAALHVGRHFSLRDLIKWSHRMQVFYSATNSSWTPPATLLSRQCVLLKHLASCKGSEVAYHADKIWMGL